jgi:hypothetical protein
MLMIKELAIASRIAEVIPNTVRLCSAFLSVMDFCESPKRLVSAGLCKIEAEGF